MMEIQRGDLVLEGVTFGGPLEITKGLISGDLVLRGCSTAPGHVTAMAFRSCAITHNLVLDEARVLGTIDLTSTSVGETLSCLGTDLSNPGATTLQADGFQCQGKVIFGKGKNPFSSRGTLRFAHAKLGSGLEIRDSLFLGAQGKALIATGIQSDGDLVIEGGAIAHGELRFTGARIKGDVRVVGSTLLNPSGQAFSMAYAQVMGSVLVGQPSEEDAFKAVGTVAFPGATITGQLSCMNGSYGAEENASQALDVRHAKVGGTFQWLNNRMGLGCLNWGGMEVGSLADELTESNYPPGRYDLSGFTYGELAAQVESGVAPRLAWIKNSTLQAGDCIAQPFEQLSQFYRISGRFQDAKAVSIERERYLGHCAQRGWASRFLNRFLDWSVRYGYETWRVGYWALIVWLFGACIFAYGKHLDLLVPSPSSPQHVPLEWVPFNPLAYSADVLIPAMNLHQQNNWETLIPLDHRHGYALFLTIWTWVQIILGWVLTTLGVAGFSGLIKQH
jgi:hypothetical protein